MKVYKQETINGKQITCISHWDYDMRSFQVDDKMVLLLDETDYIHPDWEKLIQGVEDHFLEFLQLYPYTREVNSIEEIIPYFKKMIDAETIEFTSPDY
ncbi:hypothetical protein CLV62_15220 [Dysgonomonas alginatilytica]|uniref:Uncharacterized protein n=1 Tax=Dysgonomonas alginatilytica TaxID=1605892 RepID=A0A2V3PJX7_9BACT|nr:hypothetical protein [Dysgonomonas alginatilytica]PXV57436.1 hypothetical protein CLV62_15220 [Dysgonomonas alginatilytica]